MSLTLALQINWAKVWKISSIQDLPTWKWKLKLKWITLFEVFLANIQMQTFFFNLGKEFGIWNSWTKQTSEPVLAFQASNTYAVCIIQKICQVSTIFVKLERYALQLIFPWSKLKSRVCTEKKTPSISHFRDWLSLKLDPTSKSNSNIRWLLQWCH